LETSVFVYKLVHETEEVIHRIIRRGIYTRGWYKWRGFLFNSRTNQVYWKFNP
jgi:hypothetical protein